MSTAEPALPLEPNEPVAAVPAKPGLVARCIARFERAGERLNPILVKECRQALKSQQFAITFALLLIAGWLWSIIGIALIGPGAYFNFAGREMFFGYYMILAFPLLVIVPVGAFRSLAAEYEDRTFELVSITSLHPRQIVAGKLGSAVVQMIVYLSALAPCLAFTYILRGIDIVQIVFILTFLSLASLGFSTVALMFSTAVQEKHWHGILSIAAIIGCLGAFGGSCGLCREILLEGTIPIQDPGFWVAMAVMFSVYASYLTLFFQVAAAQLTFASDNRSTPLRVTMLLQSLLFIGCVAGVASVENRFSTSSSHLREALLVFEVILSVHWYVMGLFLVTEQPTLSPRVKRNLPHSFLGRVFLTWFNPGPGTGFLFVVCNVLAVSILSLGVLGWSRLFGHDRMQFSVVSAPFFSDDAAVFTVLIAWYVIFYLGLGKLLVTSLRRRIRVGAFSGVAIQILLLMVGGGIPLLVEKFVSYQRSEYTGLLRLTNPFMVLEEVQRQSRYGGTSGMLHDVGGVLLALTLIVFALNLPGVVREVRHVRIAAPRRVTEDEVAPLR